MTEPAQQLTAAEPVFCLKLELRLAPPLNDLVRTRHWSQARRLSREIADRILHAKRDWPEWSCGAKVETSGRIIKGKLCVSRRKHGGRRRRLRVVRYTSGRLDESAGVDTLGGKLVVDELVTANILRDDSEEWVERVGRAERAPQGQGCLVVEVFEAP